MITNLHVIAFLPMASLALGIVIADAAPVASAQEMISSSVATPWSLLRRDAEQIIGRALSLPPAGQSVPG